MKGKNGKKEEGSSFRGGILHKGEEQMKETKTKEDRKGIVQKGEGRRKKGTKTIDRGNRTGRRGIGGGDKNKRRQKWSRAESGGIGRDKNKRGNRAKRRGIVGGDKNKRRQR